MQGGDDGFDGNDVNEAIDKEGDSDNNLESEHIQGSQGDDNNLRGGNSGDEGKDLGGGDKEPGTGDVNDESRNGDKEEDYGYRYLVDEDFNEEDSDDNEPLDIADDALGPEDGEEDDDEVNLLGFAVF
jgi:hypothetical protein